MGSRGGGAPAPSCPSLAALYITESERRPGTFDLGGALTSTAGMTALVYGFIRAAQEGWSDLGTIGSFAAAAVLLAVFFSIETRTRQPITPLHLFRERDRAGSYAGRCGVYCGLQHTDMPFTVRVLAPDAFSRWLRAASAGAGP